MIVYGNQDIYKTTVGINWRAIWANSGYSNTSVSYSRSRFSEDFIETNTDQKLITNRSLEQEFRLRNSNHFRLNQNHRIEFGFEVKHLNYSYNNYFSEYTDALGDTTAQFTLSENFTAQKYGIFFNYIVSPFHKLTTTFGLRGDFFSYNDHFNMAPRFSFSYAFTKRTSLNGSAGLYYQNLPLILTGQRKENKNLNDPKAIHYVLGLEHLLTESTRFTIEVYQKDYSNFPVDPEQKGLFLIDELFYRYGFFFNHGPLKDNGKARTRGIELTLQKKLATDFYGLLSASWFRSEYKDENGLWRNRVFDNRFIFSAEGGYKPSNKWEYSLRWIYAGGTPYTPLDIEKSSSLNRAVQDENRINQARYPDYHSLNIRVDRRFHFNTTNLVAYFSIWNLYNQKNIATYFWNENKNKKDVIYQWSMLPILGLEFEF